MATAHARTVAKVLYTDDAHVVQILDAVFPEFKALVPESSRARRSHMTSGWFMTLGSIWDHSLLPSDFSRSTAASAASRRKVRRGSPWPTTRHRALSRARTSPNEAGKAVSAALLAAFGFTDFRFQPDEKRSKSSCPNSQTEVYAPTATRQSAGSRSRPSGSTRPRPSPSTGVSMPVMNLGLGVERLAMVLHQADDVRAMVFPQFHPRSLTDAGLALRSSASARSRPRSRAGAWRAQSRPWPRLTPTRRARSRSRRRGRAQSRARPLWSTSRSPSRPRSSSGRPA